MINKYSILNGAKCFSAGGLQNYLVFESFRKNSVPINYANNIELIKVTKASTGLSQEEIISPYELDSSFSPNLDGFIIFKGICLKQKSVSFLHKSIVILYISCKLDTWPKNLNTDFTLGNCLFGAVKITKNADPDKYKYSGYGVGFDSRSELS